MNAAAHTLNLVLMPEPEMDVGMLGVLRHCDLVSWTPSSGTTTKLTGPN